MKNPTPTTKQGKEITDNKFCKCGHPLSEHFDPSYSCGKQLEPDMADGLFNFCRHCEEDSNWKLP